jgi:hypothetical protein
MFAYSFVSFLCFIDYFDLVWKWQKESACVNGVRAHKIEQLAMAFTENLKFACVSVSALPLFLLNRSACKKKKKKEKKQETK